MYFLRWGSEEWSPVEVPEEFSLMKVVGSDGDTVYVTGATGTPPGSSVPGLRPQLRPAMFEVDFSRATVTELGLPGRGPERPLRDRLPWNTIDPTVGRLEDGAGGRDFVVCTASYGEEFEHEVLHAIDRSRDRWSTVTLYDERLVSLGVRPDGTAHAVTSAGDVWTAGADRDRLDIADAVRAARVPYPAPDHAAVGGDAPLVLDVGVDAAQPVFPVLLAYRLAQWLPPKLPTIEAAGVVPLQECEGCDRPFRSHDPGRCRDCRPPEPSAAA